MNSIFTSPRGFPFDAKTLKEIQDLSIPGLIGLTNIVPNNCRLKGVVAVTLTQPATVSDGIIIWNKEILPFVGGANDAQFSIMEEIENRPFNIGTDVDPILQDNPAYKRRWAQVGNLVGAESVHSLNALKPIPFLLNNLAQGVVYLGTLVPGWSDQFGTIIPITFPTVGTANYMILTSFYRAGVAAQPTFDFELFEKTTTGFKLRIKNISAALDFVFFEYILIPSASALEIGG